MTLWYNPFSFFNVVAELTEKILSIRAHTLRQSRERTCLRAMSIALGHRHKLMKALYKRDFELYKYVCKILRLKCVRFSIPDSRDRSKVSWIDTLLQIFRCSTRALNIK